VTAGIRLLLSLWCWWTWRGLLRRVQWRGGHGSVVCNVSTLLEVAAHADVRCELLVVGYASCFAMPVHVRLSGQHANSG
jgi:hypothetical protein